MYDTLRSVEEQPVTNVVIYHIFSHSQETAHDSFFLVFASLPLAIIEKAAGDSEAIAFDGGTYIEYHNAVTKR